MNQPKPDLRPVFHLSRSPLEVGLEVVALVGVLACCWIAVQSWNSLPETIPLHFGLSGKPDGWGNKITIWLLPVLAVGLEILLTVVGRYPHTWNYPVPITEENARAQYVIGRSLLTWMKAELSVHLTLLLWLQVQVAVGKAQLFSIGWVFGMVAVIFGTVAWYLWRAYAAR